MSQKFNDMFDAIPTFIVYDSKWSTGDGYFDYAVHGEHAPILRTGQIVKTMSSMCQRRLILIGTPFGNIVLFDRYSTARRKGVLGNVPEVVWKIYGLSGVISEATLKLLLGSIVDKVPYDNIGHRLSRLRFADIEK